ncbi:hypothetical protein TEPIDINF_002382 [Tepidibacillus infernus]|uniref:YkvI family membrane protein n=1 Tax=Tepidibacillus infernus TaxID=1806172 RepID=UPI003B742408
MQKKMWNGLKIGLTIMGTTIGAGFASGREIWEFFTSYGRQSIFGLMIALTLFSLSSIFILWMSWRHQTENYYDILVLLLGNTLSRLFDTLIFLYLVSGSIIMLAGSGATFVQWNLPFILGVGIVSIAIWLVLTKGVRGLINLNSILMPIKTVIILAIGLLYISRNPSLSGPFTRHYLEVWPSAITYVAFNMISLLGVLSTMGKRIETKGEIIFGGITSIIGLGLVGMMINLSLLRVPHVDQYEIPLFSLIPTNQPILLLIVSVILWLAIYTTALSNIHALVYRIQNKINLSTGKISLGIILFIIPFTFIGFANLVKVLYPLYGVLNLYVLSILILYPFQKTR